MLRTFVLYAVSKENIESKRRLIKKENKNVHMRLFTNAIPSQMEIAL